MPDAAVTACKLCAVIFPGRLKIERGGIFRREPRASGLLLSLDPTHAQTHTKKLTDKLCCEMGRFPFDIGSRSNYEKDLFMEKPESS